MIARALVSAVFVLVACSCIGVTEGGLVSFEARAAGPADATGAPLVFRTPGGYDVTLRKARLHVGALYLNGTVPLTSERESSCILPGTYVGQVTSANDANPNALGGVDVDLLAATPVPFPTRGTGLADRAQNGEVWLTGNGNVEAAEDKTVVFAFEGEARRAGLTYPFAGTFTIGSNRAKAPRSGALPGSNPICQERIVTGIPMALRLQEGGVLTLRADPRAIFATADFALLDPNEAGVYEFLDREEGQPSIAAYFALRSSQGVYSFAFDAPPQ